MDRFGLDVTRTWVQSNYNSNQKCCGYNSSDVQESMVSVHCNMLSYTSDMYESFLIKYMEIWEVYARSS